MRTQTVSDMSMLRMRGTLVLNDAKLTCHVNRLRRNLAKFEMDTESWLSNKKAREVMSGPQENEDVRNSNIEGPHAGYYDAADSKLAKVKDNHD